VFKAVLFVSLFASLNALGGPTSPEQAASMVRGWLLLTPTPLKTPLSGRTIGSVQAIYSQNGAAIYYAVPLQPEGFIIASADTEVEPVIAFSATGGFEANPDSPLFALLDRDLRARLDAVRQQTQPNGANPTAASGKWTRFTQRGTGPQPMDAGLDVVDDPRVAPFIQSRWSQDNIWDGSRVMACYNYYTPPYASGATTNYPCGCVNTAWAQIMRYFQYPTQPIGMNFFAITVDGIASIRALRGGDGQGGPYNWSQMALVPGVGTTEQQRQAIGALTADVGVACQTIYGPGGSGAGISDSVLKRVFQFANVSWDGGLGSRFADEVNANLDVKLPVYLAILGGSNGHAVVCDGYGYNWSTPYHHLNLGWGGSSDAWYNLPNVGTSYGFNTISSVCYNIFTNGTGEIISGRVLAGVGNRVPLFDATVTATRMGGGTYTATTDTNGIYGLVKLPSASQYTLIVTKAAFISTNATFSTGTSSSGACGNIWGADFALIPAVWPPLIVTQPESQMVNIGSNATFNISVVSGLPLSYQWQYRTGESSAWSDLCENASYSGSQSASLSVVNANVTGLEFRCVVINPSGSVTSSPPAVLTLKIPLVFTTLAGLAGSSGSGDGTGSAARFSYPGGVAADSAGNVYVADTYNHTIRRGFAGNAAPVIVSSWPSFGFIGGQFGLNLAGPAGRVVMIDASTNMKTWLPLWTNTIGGGALYFSDPQSSTYPNRFYRAHTP
jgi:hypothetical protein